MQDAQDCTIQDSTMMHHQKRECCMMRCNMKRLGVSGQGARQQVQWHVLPSIPYLLCQHIPSAKNMMFPWRKKSLLQKSPTLYVSFSKRGLRVWRAALESCSTGWSEGLASVRDLRCIHCAAVCCSVLQCVAALYSVLQCVAVC